MSRSWPTVYVNFCELNFVLSMAKITSVTRQNFKLKLERTVQICRYGISFLFTSIVFCFCLFVFFPFVKRAIRRCCKYMYIVRHPVYFHIAKLLFCRSVVFSAMHFVTLLFLLNQIELFCSWLDTYYIYPATQAPFILSVQRVNRGRDIISHLPYKITS